MTYRSTPAFAVGGVPYFNDAHEQYEPGPSCGWRCFFCNCHFSHWAAAARHFGMPDSNRLLPACREELQ